MRIAVVAPVRRAIKKNVLYGGIERIIKSLVKGALKDGHKITLYAPWGSDLEMDGLNVRLTTTENVDGLIEKTRAAEIALFKRLHNEQAEFDLIHSHIEPAIAEVNGHNLMAKIQTPLMVSMHNQTYFPDYINYYRKHTATQKIFFVFISHNQAKPLSFLPNQTVIYNGIDLTDLTFNATPRKKQLFFLGRITPEKGAAEAIEIAQRSGWPLDIAAAIDQTQKKYFLEKIEPFIDNRQIRFLGEIDLIKKNELLGLATAVLFPIKWQEPFGLVMVEALACGTPVVAPRTGSVPEIIKDGRNGFIVSPENIVAESLAALEKIKNINREYCSFDARNRFNENVMIRRYLALYDNFNCL